MKLSPKLHSVVKFATTPMATFLFACTAFAQRDRSPAATAMAGGVFFFMLLIGLAAYIYISLAVKTIAEKTNTENPWMAWIPIVNIVLLLNIAKKPIWWIVLFLIPLVNIVIAVLVWMGVAEARNKPNWWGILMIIPGANLIVPGILAWSD